MGWLEGSGMTPGVGPEVGPESLGITELAVELGGAEVQLPSSRARARLKGRDKGTPGVRVVEVGYWKAVRIGEAFKTRV